MGKINDILKNSDYDDTQFSEEEIQHLENRIIYKEEKLCKDK